MTTLHPDPRHGGYVACVKGAADLLLELCQKVMEDGAERPLTDERRRDILGMNEALASNALRVLGVAYRSLAEVPEAPTGEEIERDLTFVGLIGMIDSARPEVKEAVALARRAGIRTVMVTGDYRDTALAIAEELDLVSDNSAALTGAEMERLSDAEFEARVEEVDVYARVSPAHKVRIVEALKARGHVVAMPGNGANDAPALKRAMQWAVLASLAIILAVVYLPFLNAFFDTEPLGLREWGATLPQIFVPSLAAEINKWWLRRQDRRRARLHLAVPG